MKYWLPVTDQSIPTVRVHVYDRRPFERAGDKRVKFITKRKKDMVDACGEDSRYNKIHNGKDRVTFGVLPIGRPLMEYDRF